jgi:hypothetical protein
MPLCAGTRADQGILHDLDQRQGMRDPYLFQGRAVGIERHHHCPRGVRQAKALEAGSGLGVARHTRDAVRQRC